MKSAVFFIFISEVQPNLSKICIIIFGGYNFLVSFLQRIIKENRKKKTFWVKNKDYSKIIPNFGMLKYGLYIN